jgi:hypothetical protein
MTADRIRVLGERRQEIDLEGLVQAILLIAEQQLRDQQAENRHHRPDGEDRRRSA